MILEAHGPADVTVIAPRGETRESFIDVVRHYPPLHMVTWGQRVLEARWYFGDSRFEADLPRKRVQLKKPQKIRLEPVKAASSIAWSTAVEAFGFYEEDSDVTVRYYEGRHEAGESLRSVLVCPLEETFEKYLEKGYDPARTPYMLPLRRAKAGYKLLKIPLGARVRGLSSLLYPVYEGDAKYYTKRVEEEVRIRDPIRTLYKRCRGLPPATVTPLRFYPDLGIEVLDRRDVDRHLELRLSRGLVLEVSHAVARIALILESVRTQIYDTLITVQVREREATGESRFGTVFSTQGVRVNALVEGLAAAELAKLVLEGQGLCWSQVRWKILYHLMLGAAKRAARRAGLALSELELSWAVAEAWRVLRRARLYRSLSRPGPQVDLRDLRRKAKSSKSSKLASALIVSVLELAGVWKAAEALKHHEAERLTEALKSELRELGAALRSMVENGSLDLGAGPAEEYVRRALEHTLAHWVVAEAEALGGLPSEDLGFVELSEGFLAYEICEGGHGVLWSIFDYKSPKLGRGALLEWLLECSRAHYAHQLSALLDDSEHLKRVLRTGPDALERVLGVKPTPSIRFLVAELKACSEALARALALRRLVLSAAEALGAEPSPSEVLLYAGLLGHEKLEELVGITAREAAEVLGVPVQEQRVLEDLEKVLRHRELLKVLQEEYAALDVDTHHICHSTRACPRYWPEEVDQYSPMPYLSRNIVLAALTAR